MARELVEHRKLDALRLIYGSVPDTLSQLIRTAFVAPEGHVLIDADFSAIEARVISWLAGEQWRLEVFRTHGKIYEASASQMFGVPIELIKKGNPEYALRQKGKVAELALGYQGSTGALINMGALDMGIPEEDLPDIVSRWREANKRIRDLWYSMDNAAVQVITQGGSVGINGLLLAREYDYNQGTDCFTIQLPSGRKLYYVSPGIGENQWGNPSISYMGMDQKTKRWKRIETYGGKLVENIVQAIARDCLAIAIENLEAQGLLVKVEPHKHNVGCCQRCGTTVEPRASLQWFVSMKELAQPAIDVVKSGELRYIPKRFENGYLYWMENIRDWCISRQLWWGHRIPAYYCQNPSCKHTAISLDPLEKCPKCGSYMTLSRTKKGDFYVCANETCRERIPAPQSEENE